MEDLRIRQAFTFYDLNSIGLAIRDAWDAGKTPEAVEIAWNDWRRIEDIAHGLGSHPAFLRFPLIMAEHTAIVTSERLDDHA